MKSKLSFLFVCMGNICRSPTAEAVFRQVLINSNFDESTVFIDSAGTAGYHIGEAPDPRSVQAGKNRNYELSDIRARQINDTDFEDFDFLIVMDKENHSSLVKQAERSGNIKYKNKIKLFLDFSSQSSYSEVPDPYYGGKNGFDLVIDLIEDASFGLLKSI